MIQVESPNQTAVRFVSEVERCEPPATLSHQAADVKPIQGLPDEVTAFLALMLVTTWVQVKSKCVVSRVAPSGRTEAGHAAKPAGRGARRSGTGN